MRFSYNGYKTTSFATRRAQAQERKVTDMEVREAYILGQEWFDKGFCQEEYPSIGPVQEALRGAFEMGWSGAQYIAERGLQSSTRGVVDACREQINPSLLVGDMG